MYACFGTSRRRASFFIGVARRKSASHLGHARQAAEDVALAALPHALIAAAAAGRWTLVGEWLGERERRRALCMWHRHRVPTVAKGPGADVYVAQGSGAGPAASGRPGGEGGGGGRQGGWGAGRT